MKKPTLKFGRSNKNKTQPSAIISPDHDKGIDMDIDLETLDEMDFEPTPSAASPLKKQPKAASSKSKPLLIALACLLLALLAYFLFKLLTPETTPVAPQPDTTNQPPQAEAVSTPSAVTTPAAAGDTADASDPATTDDTAAVTFDPDTIPDPDAILNAQIPENESLIKEEIDRLDDEYTRLAEQEQIGKQQAELMQDLTTKKAEQIALLEKQIAQLEAEKTETAQPKS